MKNITPIPPPMSAQRIVLTVLVAGIAAVSLTGCLFVRDGRGDNRGPSEEHMHAFDHNGGHDGGHDDHH